MAVPRAVLLLVMALVSRINSLSPGYSFAKFMGPVSGREVKVAAYDDGMYHQHDYAAKPDYHFEYGVQDPKSKVHQSRHETRHGDTVHGEYSVLDPDGKLRTVKYTADKKNGFQAQIITDGHVIHHPQPPVMPIHPVVHNSGGEDEEYENEGSEEQEDSGGEIDSSDDEEQADEDDEYY